MAKKKTVDEEVAPVEEPVVEEVLDTVVVSQVPVCDEKSGHIVKMNYLNASGQLVR